VNLRSLLRQPVLTVALHDREARWTLGRGERISGIGRVILAPGLIDDGVVNDTGAVARALREAPDFPGTARMQTVAALPAARAVFRRIDVPHVDGKAFDEFVTREIRRELPMVAEHAYVSWRVAESAGGTARVFIVGVARDVLDSHINALQEAGLAPVSADLRVISAARAVGRPTVVIAHIEDQEVELGVFDHGLPSIVRFVAMTAPCGEQAWVDQLTQELNRALKFFRDTRRDDSNMTSTIPICLVGAAARSAGLSEAIIQATGHETMTPSFAFQLPAPDALRFAANIGASMKDLAA
jgi:Tfp pilus assembly PilM family ATPase